jgi:hypothetical protein
MVSPLLSSDIYRLSEYFYFKRDAKQRLGILSYEISCGSSFKEGDEKAWLAW